MDETLAGRIRARKNLPPPAARKHLRRAAGLTQSDVAGQVGVDRAEVSRWEDGSRFPGRDNLTAYSILLDEIARELANSGRDGAVQ